MILNKKEKEIRCSLTGMLSNFNDNNGGRKAAAYGTGMLCSLRADEFIRRRQF